MIQATDPAVSQPPSDPSIDPCAVWLCQLPGITARLVRALIAARGSADAVLTTSSRELRELGVPSALVAQIVAGPRQIPHVAAGLRGLQRLGIRAVPLAATDYPDPLRALDQPPLVLHIQGAWPLPDPLVFAARPDDLAPKLAAQWITFVQAIAPHAKLAALRVDVVPDADPPELIGVPWGLMLARGRMPQPLWQRVLDRSLTLVSIVPPTAPPDQMIRTPLATTLLALSAAAVLITPAADDPIVDLIRPLARPAFAFGVAPRDPVADHLRRLRAGQPGVRTLLSTLGIRTAGSATVRQERLF